MTAPSRLEILRDEIAKLRDVAKAEGLPTLVYLLEMAMVEARAAARLRKPEK